MDGETFISVLTLAFFVICAVIRAVICAGIFMIIRLALTIIYDYKSYGQSSGDRLWCLPGAHIDFEDWKLEDDEEDDEEDDDVEYGFGIKKNKVS